jgi:hypothetical protein
MNMPNDHSQRTSHCERSRPAFPLKGGVRKIYIRKICHQRFRSGIARQSKPLTAEFATTIQTF